MNKKIFFKQLCGLLLSLSVLSCTSVADVSVLPSGDVVLALSVQPSENMKALVENMSGQTTSLFDEQTITENLKTENIQTLSFKTDSVASVEGRFRIPADRVAASDMFVIDTENKKMTCNISKEVLGPLMETFPQDVKDYLDLFVSPITSGEQMTAAEYEQLIASVYGPKIAGELKTAFFKVTVSCPGVIDSVKTEPEGRVRYFAGNSATMTVPLSYMLSLEKPLLITIVYK